MENNIKNRSNFEYKFYPSELTVKEDGGWTKVIYTKKADDWRSLDPRVLRMKYEKEQYVEEAYVIQYKANGDFYFGEYRKPLVKGSGRIFPKKSWLGVIKTEGGKTRTGRELYFDSQFISCFLEFFGVECLIKNKDKTGNDELLHTAFTKKPVLKGIISGRITNRKALIKTFISSCYKITRFQYETIEKYYEKGYDPYHNSLATLYQFTTDFDKAVELITNPPKGFDRNLFNDLLRDAFYLDKVINPLWSVKRMQEEHQKNIEIQTLLNEEALSDEPVFENAPVINEKDIQGKVLNSEREVYTEASYQHNCLHSHYWSRISKKDYIAISLTFPERITVGLSVLRNDGHNTLDIDQMHTRYNNTVKTEHQEAILDYIRRNQDLLTSLVDAQEFKDTYIIRAPRPTPVQQAQTQRRIHIFSELARRVKESVSVIMGECTAVPIGDYEEDLVF